MKFEVGLRPILHDGESDTPDGFNRDDILAHLAEQVADETHDDAYELRELLSSDFPLSSDDGAQTGELLVMMRADKVGGPLEQTDAQRVIAKVDRIGRRGTIELDLDLIHARTVALPPPSVNGALAFADNHPLAGVYKVNARALLDRSAEIRGPDADRFLALLEVCVEEKLPISLTR